MSFDVFAYLFGSISNAGSLGAQLRIGNHFFDIAQPVRPLTKVFSRNRSPLPRVVDAGDAAALLCSFAIRIGILVKPVSSALSLLFLLVLLFVVIASLSLALLFSVLFLVALSGWLFRFLI
jgi:hypothetical protein